MVYANNMKNIRIVILVLICIFSLIFFLDSKQVFGQAEGPGQGASDPGQDGDGGCGNAAHGGRDARENNFDVNSSGGGSWSCSGNENLICTQTDFGFFTDVTSGGGGGGGGGGGTTLTCPAGYELQNGWCQLVSCPAGYIFSGGACVISSCPSGYTFQDGECVRQCVAQYFCVGNQLMHRSQQCTDSVAQTCPYGCINGGCIAQPPPPEGNIRAVPSLVRSGNTTQVIWSAVNVSSCTVVGTNGNSWAGTSSGSAGQVSSSITEQTKFTLMCNALTGGTPPNFERQATVNVIPAWQEQ